MSGKAKAVKNEFIVFCDNVSDKHGKKHPNPVVQGFVYSEDRQDQLGQGWTDSNTSKRLRQNQAHLEAAQALIGNEKFSHRNAEHRGKQHRESWTLTCHKCGYSVPVVHQKLYPALTRMRAMGIDRIGLIAIQDGLKDVS